MQGLSGSFWMSEFLRAAIRLGIRAAIGVACLTGGPSGAAEVLKVVTEEWAPFNYSEHGKLTGLSVELLDAAARRANFQTSIEVLPWERAYRRALSEPGVLIFTMARKSEREHLFEWVAPVYPRTIYLYKSRHRADIRLETLPDARRYSVVAAGESDASAVDLRNIGLERGKNLLYVYGSDAQRLRMLLAGRVDLMPMHELQVPLLAREIGVAPGEFVRLLPLNVREDDYYFAFSKGTSPEQVERLRKAFKSLRADGTYDTIVRRYRP